MKFGEATNTHHLARRLADAGVEVHVLTRALDEAKSEPGIVLHALMRNWTWARVPQLRAFLKKVRPDAILQMHLGGIYDMHPMMTFFPTVAKRELAGVRFVTRFENPLSEAEPSRMSLFWRLYRRAFAYYCGANRVHYNSGTLLRDSDAVIALCHNHQRILLSQDPLVNDKIRVVPPPANIEVVPDVDGRLRAAGRQRLEAGADCFLLGYVGYLYKNKGIETLLTALADLKARGRKVRLVVLGGPVAPSWPGDRRGESYCEDIQTLARTLGVEREVVWNGAFSKVTQEVAELIHAVDVFVLPFDNGVHLNNSSVASLMTYGAAIITTAQGHTDEQFVDGQNVVLCAPKDPSAIVDAIEGLISSESRMQSLRAGARQLASDWFSWDRAMRMTLQALKG